MGRLLAPVSADFTNCLVVRRRWRLVKYPMRQPLRLVASMRARDLRTEVSTAGAKMKRDSWETARPQAARFRYGSLGSAVLWMLPPPIMAFMCVHVFLAGVSTAGVQVAWECWETEPKVLKNAAMNYPSKPAT